MRIIGTIPHPTLRISVFKNDNRLSVKFENPQYEITYKLGEDERFRTADDVAAWIDAPLLEQVEMTFRQMHQARLEALSRHFTAGKQEEFDHII